MPSCASAAATMVAEELVKVLRGRNRRKSPVGVEYGPVPFCLYSARAAAAKVASLRLLLVTSLVVT